MYFCVKQTDSMKHRIESDWKGKMKFDTEVNGHHFFIDQAGENGDNSGPRPKPLMLAALAGCTGMDVISILKKMRQEVEYFNTRLENVKVVKVNPVMHDIKDPSFEKHNHLEQIELRYEKITWTYKDGNIIHSDSWNERATA